MQLRPVYYDPHFVHVSSLAGSSACAYAHVTFHAPSQVHTVQLRPSQLVLLPDGTSLGFQAPGGNTSEKIAIVPVTKVGIPWRETWRMVAGCGWLRSRRFRVEHGAEGLQYLTADDLQAQSGDRNAMLDG